jgi:hypothetical protein
MGIRHLFETDHIPFSIIWLPELQLLTLPPEIDGRKCTAHLFWEAHFFS